jgi:hypothetical protein
LFESAISHHTLFMHSTNQTDHKVIFTLISRMYCPLNKSLSFIITKCNTPMVCTVKPVNSTNPPDQRKNSHCLQECVI